MTKLRLGDYCCQGGDKTIDRRCFQSEDLIISSSVGTERGTPASRERDLIFSPLGNTPTAPRLALVGITPGAQSKKFEQLLSRYDVLTAAKKAAFAGAQNTIRSLINAHGFAKALNIDSSGDLNDNDEIFTTSLVKCCLKVDGSYKYKAPEIQYSSEASYCVLNRFLPDIEKYDSITHVVVFGDPGWEALQILSYKGMSLKRYLEERGIAVLNFPHFAQNFQQRKIFALNPTQDERYFRENPHHVGYKDNALRMRKAVIEEVSRLIRLSREQLRGEEKQVRSARP